VAEAAHTASNMRASIVVSVFENLVGGTIGGGVALAQRTPGSPIRFVPIVVGLLGIGTGSATDSTIGMHPDSEPPCRVRVKQ
jgi:hypothetical protein